MFTIKPIFLSEIMCPHALLLDIKKYPKRLEAVITTKVASCKHSVKGLNTYAM